MRLAPLLRLAVVGLVVAGCTAEADVGDDVGLADQEINTVSPIKPVDLASCWVVPDTSTTDAFFQTHSLTCKRAATADYPLVPDEILVEVATAKGRAFHGSVAATEALLGRFHNDDLPLKVRTRLMFPRTTSVGDMFALKDERTVTTLTEATAEKPIVWASPFTMWGISLRAEDDSALWMSGSYEAPSGAYKVGWNFTIPDEDVNVLPVRVTHSVQGGATELALLAPAAGPVTLQIMGQPVTITGPGSYVYGGGTLRKEAGVAPPDPDPVDIAPAPAPTCGAEGQAKCPNGECAPNHREDGNLCRACGADGQTYCGTYNTRTCNPGTRLNGDRCVICGDDGQTYCGTYNTRTCNAGTRLVGDLCRACGGVGQTYCGTYNDRTCNPGLRVSGDTCVE